MRNHIEPVDIANDIYMSRSSWPGAVCLVEGDSDSRLLSRVLRPEAIQIAFGKENVIEVVEICIARGADFVLGVVDLDDWAVDGWPAIASPISDVVIGTDLRDFENMAISTDASDRLAEQFCYDPKRTKFVSANGPVWKNCRKAAEVVGRLRWLSKQHGWNLKFSGLNFKKIVGKNTILVDVDEACRKLSARTPGGPSHSEMLSTYQSTTYPPGEVEWAFAAGHDVMKFFSLALTHLLSSWNAGEVAPKLLERTLFAAYTGDALRSSQLYSSLQAWAGARPKYMLMAA